MSYLSKFQIVRKNNVAIFALLLFVLYAKPKSIFQNSIWHSRLIGYASSFGLLYIMDKTSRYRPEHRLIPRHISQLLVFGGLMLRQMTTEALVSIPLIMFVYLPKTLNFPRSDFLKNQLHCDFRLQSENTGYAQRLIGYKRSNLLYQPKISPQCKTVAEIWETALLRYGDNPLAGHRKLKRDGSFGKYVFETYSEGYKRMIRFSNGLCIQCPELRTCHSSTFQSCPKLGIYSKNCIEAMYSIYGAHFQNICAVPLYDSIGDQAVRYIICHAELSVVCVSESNLNNLLLLVPQQCPKLKTIIVIKDHTLLDGKSHVDRGPRVEHGVNIIPFEFVEKMGEAPPDNYKPNSKATATDLAFILYTSGTTGTPKGVMLTHAGFTAVAGGLSNSVVVKQTDVHLSYLPMAHAFENAVLISGVMYGACVGFYHGDVKQLTEDAQCLKPTIFIGVPRVFQRVQQVILQQFAAKPFFIRRIIYHACQEQIQSVRKTGKRIKLWDLLVFRQVKLALGGRVRIMCTGSAPLAPEIQEFIKVCFDVPMVEGYGMTETHGVCTAMLGGAIVPQLNGSEPLFERTVGHVGPPLACSEITLESVPELGYTDSSDPLGPCGEILVRGPNVFQGYFKMPLETAETLRGGWLHTGDIGRLNANGTFSVIDRRKNIFKLSHGEYIAVEKIEQVYQSVPYIGQIFVYGDSLKNKLVAIVVPDPLELIPKLKEGRINGFRIGSKIYKRIPTLSTDLQSWLPGFHDLCSNSDTMPLLSEFILDHMTVAAKNANLRGFEVVKSIYLEGNLNALMQGFAVENGLLTPTFKLKRPILKKRYQQELDRMYANE